MEFISKWFSMLNEIGVNNDGSTMRLGYSDTEDAMMDCIVDIGRGFGLRHYSDEAGNTFVYNGDGTGDYTIIGSHVDSVLNGGKYDGIAGILSAMLVLKWIEDGRLNIPVKLAMFRMEESSTFGVATVGSKLVTGQLSEEGLTNAKNSDSVTLYDLLLKRGFKTKPALIKNVKQYLELHIEQGKVLEAKKLRLGVVNSIAAPVRMWVNITGMQDHTGATPMGMRHDALAGAAELILAVEKFATDELVNASVGTAGVIRCEPNAFNVVPGEVKLGVDIRGIDSASRQRVVDNTESETAKICERRGLTYSINHVSSSEPVQLDGALQRKLSETADMLGMPHIVMPSGAGHDAMNFVDICPVGMLFVPCKAGISHNKEEYAELNDVVNGSKVLLEYLKNNG